MQIRCHVGAAVRPSTLTIKKETMNKHINYIFSLISDINRFNFCRNILTEISIARDNKIGGPGFIVEIDVWKKEI